MDINNIFDLHLIIFCGDSILFEMLDSDKIVN